MEGKIRLRSYCLLGFALFSISSAYFRCIIVFNTKLVTAEDSAPDKKVLQD